MRIIEDYVLFSTKKAHYLYGGIVGLSTDLNVTGGYDQRFLTNLQRILTKNLH